MADDLDLRMVLELQQTIGHQVVALTGELGPLGAITRVATSTMASADFASCTTLYNDSFKTLAATDPLAEAADQLQYDLLSGPCVDAVQNQEVISTGNLPNDGRWPTYGPRALAQFGVLSVLSIRLVLDSSDPATGMNVYSRSPDAFDAESRLYGTLLATQAARAVTEQRASHLERALANSRLIGTATGILMNQHKITPQDAFELLRIASQHRNRKLHEIADELVMTGRLKLPQSGRI